jgi:hypothetical protein
VTEIEIDRLAMILFTVNEPYFTPAELMDMPSEDIAHYRKLARAAIEAIDAMRGDEK